VIGECDLFFLLVCLCGECSVLVIRLFLRLCIICNGNPLFLVVVSMAFHCCLACSGIGSVIITFI
jgi:hypothetical protein